MDEEIKNEIIKVAQVWAAEQQADILDRGRKLTDEEVAIAKAAGVAHPGKVRVLENEDIVLPEGVELLSAYINLDAVKVGLAVGYGIKIPSLEGVPFSKLKVIEHELLHIAQFERLGSLDEYIKKYLNQLLEFGYESMPMEGH